jgi:hypothetical protein
MRWLLVAAVVLVLGAACNGDEDRPATGGGQQVDTVVGVVMKCQRASVAGQGAIAYTERTGETCDMKGDNGQYTATSRRLAVTVRTPSGTTYTAEVAPETVVRLGDTWPPGR